MDVRYVDAVLTIPKRTLFPMCGMNLAFNRELIGPAMYFGLMGDGQPIGRYDDMWAGWCMKVNHSSFVLICSNTSEAKYSSTLFWIVKLQEGIGRLIQFTRYVSVPPEFDFHQIGLAFKGKDYIPISSNYTCRAHE